MKTLKLGLLLLLAFICPSRVSAQNTVTLAWDPVSDPALVGYRIAYGTTPGTYPNQVDVGNVTTFKLPALPDGTYHFVVLAYGTDERQDSPFSNAVSTTLGPVPCPVLPSVFVTRWEHTTGIPGSRMRVNYQLASAVPIVEVQARLVGKTVATIKGEDLRDSAGIWFTTPASGRYALSVWVKDSNGCTRQSSSLIDLQVK